MTAQLRMRVERTADAAWQTRQAVRSLAGPEEATTVVDDVLLASSELVTNAILHTSGSITLSAWHSVAGGWRIEVEDESTVVPAPVDRRDHPERIGGRGLYIVLAVATDWGVELLATGKRCWFVINTR